MHSWRVLILPYLDEGKLFAKYRFDEPWDGPNNSKLISLMPFGYGCISNSDGLCHYAALLGEDSAWRVEPPLSVEDFPFGTARTVTVCEVLEGIP